MIQILLLCSSFVASTLAFIAWNSIGWVHVSPEFESSMFSVADALCITGVAIVLLALSWRTLKSVNKTIDS